VCNIATRGGRVNTQSKVVGRLHVKLNIISTTGGGVVQPKTLFEVYFGKMSCVSDLAGKNAKVGLK
jgi:hypothetical protein